MMVDIWLLEYGTHKGLVCVFDMAGTCWTHVMKMTLKVTKRYLAYNQEAMPVRLKALVHIHVPSFMSTIMGMMRPFIKDEVYQMIRFANMVKEVYDIIPPEVFPKDVDDGLGPSYEEIYSKFQLQATQLTSY